MAVDISNVKTGKKIGTTYTDKDVKRMASRTGAIKGSALRRTTGINKVLKMQGQRSNAKTRRGLMESVKAGKGGFTKMGGY